MQVIRDEQFNGLMMIPIFNQYNITRCNVDSCMNKPSTVVKDCINDEWESCDFALCEFHYQESKSKGRIEYKLTFSKIKD